MKNIVICVSLEDESFKVLEKLPQYVDYNNAKIHLLHYWVVSQYHYPGEMLVPFYPNQEQEKEITNKMTENLKAKKKFFANLPDSQFVVNVVAAASPKRDAVEYLKSVKADLVVTLTPEKNGIAGFFHSSFTHYLADHAHCDLLMLRA
jgi:nucleotide-binding universal stress UspA family protein